MTNLKSICIFVLLFLGFANFVIAVDPLTKIEIVDAVARKAVCNDGSPGIYYLRLGSGPGAKRWVIGLEGGFFCNTPACDGRPNFLMSSQGKPLSRLDNVGILSQNVSANPDFYNANHVVMVYCSSDFWSGNRTETSGWRPIQFRGRNIFRTVIADLKSKSGTNLLAPGTEVLLVGWSAGGTGVMVHLDWLAKQLPNAKVKGVNDAGWFPDESSLINPTFEAEIAKGIPLWGGKADLSCQRANRTRKSKCYLSTAFPYLTTPLFVQESQKDWIFVDGTQPATDEFAKAVRDSLIPVNGAYSPRSSAHVCTFDWRFNGLNVENHTLQQVLGNWFFDRAGKIKAIKK